MLRALVAQCGHCINTDACVPRCGDSLLSHHYSLHITRWQPGGNVALCMQAPASEDNRCFSILTETQALHLSLPKGGNGRSRREWMDAIAGLDVSSDAVSKTASDA